MTYNSNSTTHRRECLAVTTNPNMYLASADDVSLGRQQVDDFSFALVSPLRTEHHRHLVPRVIARPLLPSRSGLIRVFVVFRRPAERHDSAGSRLSVSRGLNRLQQWHSHICNIISCDVRARRTQVKCVAVLGKVISKPAEAPAEKPTFTEQPPGCWSAYLLKHLLCASCTTGRFSPSVLPMCE